MKVSVIIPVYNTEAYLRQCVDSVIGQTYNNIEVILVDDGSKDGSPAVCDGYAASDTRIRVIHKENGGLSDARNRGVDEATGDYVIFIDSDDYWATPTSLEELVAEAEQSPECDFIGFNCSYFYQATNKVERWIPYAEELSIAMTPANCIVHLVASGVFPMSACFKLIKRSILADKLRFVKGLTSEDIPWFISLMESSHKCRFVNNYAYVYRKDVPTSISSSFSLKKYNDLFSILESGVAEVHKWDKKTQDALLSFWAYELCILRAQTGYMPKAQRKESLASLRKYEWLLRYKTNPKVRLIARIQRVLGWSITSSLLHSYLKRRMA